MPAGTFWIEIQDGSDKGHRIALGKKTLIIGRENSADIYLRDVEVSRKHAKIMLTTTGYVVTDLDSSNGTFVDDRPIREHRLIVGNVIRTGQIRILFGQTRAGKPVAIGPMAKIDLLDDDNQVNNVVSAIDARRAIPKSMDLHGELSHQEVRNFQSIYEFLTTVSGVLDLDVLMDRVLSLVLEKTGADRGCILLLDEQTGSITSATTRRNIGETKTTRIPVSRTILNLVRERHEGVLTNDAKTDSRLGNAASIRRDDIREAICVPMMAQNHFLGVIYVDICSEIRNGFDEIPDRFTDDHLHLAMVIGHYTGMAVENTQFQEALLESERLATIGKVTATLAHHVKNIVHGIGGGAWLIEDGIKNELLENVNDGWQIVCKYQERINQLILNLLTISKPIEPQLTVGDVNDIVADVVELIERHALESGVKLCWTRTQVLPDVKFGKDEMQHALLNIVTNAIDACRKQPKPQIDIFTKHDDANNVVRISVVDNGEGIAPDRHGEIFELFSTNKGSRGSGIGLPVSLQILKAHGGDIEMASQIGKGSKFDLILPVEPVKTGDTVHGE